MIYATLGTWLALTNVWLYRMNEAIGKYDPIIMIPLLQVRGRVVRPSSPLPHTNTRTHSPAAYPRDTHTYLPRTLAASPLSPRLCCLSSLHNILPVLTTRSTLSSSPSSEVASTSRSSRPSPISRYESVLWSGTGGLRACKSWKAPPFHATALTTTTAEPHTFGGDLGGLDRRAHASVPTPPPRQHHTTTTVP